MVTIIAHPLADTTAPSLSVTSPADGATVNTSAVAVTGSASDAGKGDNGISSVMVNGIPASGETAAGAGIANWSANLTLVVGPNLITVVAKDGSPAQNATTVTLTVTYVPPDTTPPVIGPVSDLTAEATSAAGAVVTFALPPATDNVDPNPMASASPASGSTFPLGTTTVTVTATDAASNSSSKTFTVTVQDTTPPVIGAVSNVTAAASSPAGAVVSFPLPTATDAVSLPTVSCLPASGSTFPLGTTTVTCTATDTAGNTSSRTLTVRVQDETPPTMAGADT